MTWESVKKRNIASLTKDENEGKVDEMLIDFLNALNKKENFGTSSSCAGRIMLIDIPSDGKKNKTVRPGMWHRRVGIDELWNNIENYSGHELWFKQEPYILHIVCKDLAAAQKVLSIKTKHGLKRGGIFFISKDKIMIELVGTKKMEFPVKTGNTLLLTRDAMDFMLKKANKKLASNYAELSDLMKIFINEL